MASFTTFKATYGKLIADCCSPGNPKIPTPKSPSSRHVTVGGVRSALPKEFRASNSEALLILPLFTELPTVVSSYRYNKPCIIPFMNRSNLLAFCVISEKSSASTTHPRAQFPIRPLSFLLSSKPFCNRTKPTLAQLCDTGYFATALCLFAEA